MTEHEPSKRRAFSQIVGILFIALGFETVLVGAAVVALGALKFAVPAGRGTVAVSLKGNRARLAGCSFVLIGGAAMASGAVACLLPAGLFDRRWTTGTLVAVFTGIVLLILAGIAAMGAALFLGHG